MKCIRLIVIAVLLCSSFGNANSQAYRFWRDVEKPVHEGWYTITLPPAMFKNLNDDYSDLRLYRVRETDSLEIPYIIEMKVDQLADQPIEVPLLNNSIKDGKRYVTFKLDNERANVLALQVQERNFDAEVTIRGSNDQREWYVLKENQRIAGIDNGVVNYAATSVIFPTAAFRYLQAVIAGGTLLNVEGAKLLRHIVTPGAYDTCSFVLNRKVEDKEKVTNLNFRLRHSQPIGKLQFRITEPQYFYRPFVLEAVYDSVVAHQQKTTYLYHEISRGHFSSQQTNAFSVPLTKALMWRIKIFNFDDQPLEVEQVIFLTPRVELKAKLSAGYYGLLYGDPAASAPKYDLIHFQDSIPDSVGTLEVFDETELAINAGNDAITLNKIWLWVALLLAIAVLGSATIVMIRKAS